MDRLSKPSFELARVMDDGERSAVIVPVLAVPGDTRMGRRGFFGAGLHAAAAAIAVTGCKKENAGGPPPPAPPPPPELRTGLNVEKTAREPKACGKAIAHRLDIDAVILPSATTVLTATTSEIKRWTLPGGALKGELQSARGPLAASADGKVMLSAYGYWNAEEETGASGMGIWSPSGQLLGFLPGDEPSRITISADGAWAAVLAKSVLRLWNIKKRQRVRDLEEQAKPPLAMVVTAAGQVVTASEDGLRSWGADGKLLKHMEGAKLSCLATSPDQKLLVAGTPIGIAIFSLPELAPVRDVAGHPSAVTHVAFTPNGTIIAASEGGARVYESPSYARAPR